MSLLNVAASCSPASVSERGAAVERHDHEKRVYLGHATHDGVELVKIGYSNSLHQRVKSLRFHYRDFVLIGSVLGDKKTESFLHDMFKVTRVHGEWFEATPRLVRFARYVRLTGELPTETRKAIDLQAQAKVARRRATDQLRAIAAVNIDCPDSRLLESLGMDLWFD